MTNVGAQALLSIFVHLIFFILAWWALQGVNFEKLLRRPASIRARILYLLLAIAISYPVAAFFLDYLNWSLALPQIYR
ncbi:DUF1146 family protein [Sporolactobacillus spathodeae]|uniref:Integral membrane protein (TIGR02327 family) n=1 Tax=Sporolactobacillus spathodeae TaxID=1465502 RepID=A0ABS2QB54_9BACL|nr:putative integral membrane protein (TIGR02327 family) [Sporolactobacillus spathodeae]